MEQFHKTVLDEFYRVAFRKKNGRSIGELHSDLDDWVKNYNEERPHQGRWCFGKTPMQTFLDATPLAKENDRRLIIPDEAEPAHLRTLTVRSSASYYTSCTCPAVRPSRIGSPCASTTTWILVVSPPGATETAICTPFFPSRPADGPERRCCRSSGCRSRAR